MCHLACYCEHALMYVLSSSDDVAEFGLVAVIMYALAKYITVGFK